MLTDQSQIRLVGSHPTIDSVHFNTYLFISWPLARYRSIDRSNDDRARAIRFVSFLL